jgi:hypothetical protein
VDSGTAEISSSRSMNDPPVPILPAGLIASDRSWAETIDGATIKPDMMVRRTGKREFAIGTSRRCHRSTDPSIT